MPKHERWKIILILVVLFASLWAVYPPSEKIKLGLDLKGGVHILLQAKGTPENPISSDTIERLIAVLRNRIDQYGVAEPVIQREGNDRVVVELPGLDDPEAAIELIGKTAMLEFRPIIDATPRLPRKPERQNYGSDEEYESAIKRWEEYQRQALAMEKKLWKHVEENPSLSVLKGEDGEVYLLGAASITGQHLLDAKVAFDNLGRPVVTLKFNKDGTHLFDELTAHNIGRQVAIVLDGVVISAPVVQERISGGEAQISGRFTTDEAQRLAIMLRAGALPVTVEILETRSIGPTLGSDSIKSGIKAGLIGAVLVFLFMFIYYSRMGLVANLALVMTIILVLAGLASFRATLTMPGIAGIILTLGMAVDGNILIYERIKEELRSGKTVMAAIDAGFRKAFVTIVDANLTTLFAAVFLFYYGTGPVRGFAVTLSIGIIASLFCAVFVTKVLLRLFVGKRKSSVLSMTKERL